MSNEKLGWEVSPWWGGEGDYGVGECPRCGARDLKYNHDAGYYNAGLYILPGKCPVCGQTFSENYDAECWDNGWEDEDALLVVRPCDIDED